MNFKKHLELELRDMEKALERLRKILTKTFKEYSQETVLESIKHVPIYEQDIRRLKWILQLLQQKETDEKENNEAKQTNQITQ